MRARDILRRVEDGHCRAKPLRIAPGIADERVIEKARCLDAASCHGLRQPRLVDRLAEVAGKPHAARLEFVPGLQQGRAACTVRARESLRQHLRRDVECRANLLDELIEERLESTLRITGIHSLDVNALRQCIERTSAERVLSDIDDRRMTLIHALALIAAIRIAQHISDVHTRRALRKEE